MTNDADQQTTEEQQQAEEAVVRLLGRREHSAHELRQKLRQRGFTEPAIAYALGKAQQQGWQSDARYAEIWLRSELNSGNGWLKIKAKAQTKGIAEDTLQQALHEAAPDWQEICFDYVLRKFGETPPTDRSKRDKIMRHLLNRGFRFDEINNALKRQQDGDDY
ncbi:regulatory protein RecX [Pseudidiomarina atlantica]|uniref:regulatory protein RecX n=1 Tax=Pseudidiomarina atlantica TaxID=1517416 RepID=UPI00068CFED0|nr:regulatory protein RecX [Pseudidiomarina atlantica]